MQAVDNRESRLRKAFTRIEVDGKIRREDLVKLLTVSLILRKYCDLSFLHARHEDPCVSRKRRPGT